MIILIADDERLIRFTVKSMLTDILGDGKATYLEAANGRDMVKVCAENKPDIALVDIKMPYMDGLTAIAECKEQSSNTEYVILSGYSDFEYAKKGIELGITNYLLKPAKESEVRDVVEKLLVKVASKKRDLNSQFQLRIMEGFSDYSMLGSIENDSKPDGYSYLCFTVYERAGAEKKNLLKIRQKELIDEIKKLCEEVVKRNGFYSVTTTEEGYPLIIFGADGELKEYVISQMNKCFIGYVLPDRFCLSVRFETDSITSICETCEVIDENMPVCNGFSSGRVYEIDEILKVSQEDAEFLIAIDSFLNAWESADGIACGELMNSIWRDHKDERLSVDMNNMGRFCSYVTGGQISGSSLHEMCESLVSQSELMYGQMEREDTDIIDQVKQYVQDYYMNDISISGIADKFDLTANYLSTMFHQKTGNKFIDYITQVRMEAAKKFLLKNQSASVQDIALMVGYNSARHFSTIFQKVTGETPSNYRKNVNQKIDS